MPIEVRELIIKAEVNPSTTGVDTNAEDADTSIENTETIVKMCVERVLEIINEKGER